jgi:peptidyl-prolyl cis-trans isomerase B (cyclophilin B)
VNITAVPSTRDQQLAKLRARRRAERAQQRSRHRKVVAAILAGVLVLAVAGVVIGVAVNAGSSDKKSVTAAPSSDEKVACNGPAETPAPATRTFKAEPKLTIDPAADYTMTLKTSCGTITIPLNAAKAPHTVNLLNFLAADHFYDGTYCHRAVTSQTLTILQCGDPTGTGTGTIGFTIGEENLKGATYPRGTLAMAKTSAAHSTGSQFFLVDKDSQLPAQYTVVGHISSGLDVLDKLMAVGNDNSSPAGGGTPNQKIYLEKVTVTKS